MQDYGVNLICVEDGIDSSKDAGKLMISVLSAVAEIERENILVQTMEGRRQKAREGRWNGGFAPYGYQLVNGELIIAEDEAEIIRIIYDKFANTTMGMAAIAAFLKVIRKSFARITQLKVFLHHSSKVCWTIRYIAVSLHLEEEEEKMRRFREQGMNIIS